MFKRWCSSQNLSNATNLSHVLMDGGVLSVPSDKLIHFYEKCVECIKAGEPIFVVEQKTPIYNFFVDLDYKDSTAWTLDLIKNVVKIICDKVETFGAPECIISVAKPKSVGKDVIKTGIHMNWPNFPVDQAGALSLRKYIIQILTKMYGSVEWESVVDKSVYGSLSNGTKGSGFRMPWSHKKGKHVTCNGKGCPECEGGKVTESPYLPIFSFKSGSLETIDYTEPCVETLLAATIRSFVEVAVKIDDDDNGAKVEPFKIQIKNEVTNSELHSRLQVFVRNNITGQSNCEVLKILKHDKSYSCGSTSKYCSNVKREHSSNHVWFSINNGLISQKCFDEECKKFSGREYLLSASILKLLYPDTNVLSFVGTGIVRTVQSSKGPKGLANKIQTGGS